MRPQILFIFFALIIPISNHTVAYATDEDNLIKSILDDSQLYVSTLFWYEMQEFDQNALRNPKNVIDFFDYKFEYQLRPDFRYENARLKTVIKPRMKIDSTYWDHSIQNEDNTNDFDVYVNEWLIDYNIYDEMYIAGGRENLQWGPAYFISPSNPFFDDNGMSHPKKEIGGQDFLKYLWYPSANIAVSLLANIGQGRYEPRTPHEDFEPIYSLKFDYTTYRKFLSVIGSYKNDEGLHLGAYAGWNINDDFFLYTDIGLSNHTDTLYPTKENNIVKYSEKYDNYDDIHILSDLGLTYTFDNGGSLSFEYIHNSLGYNDSEAEYYFNTFRKIHKIIDIFDDYNINDIDIDQHTIDDDQIRKALYPELRLLRENYIFSQYSKVDIFNKLDLILRFTFNMDDHSANIVPIVQYDVSDNLEVFFIGFQSFGPQDAEFSSFIESNYSVGFEYIF